MTGVTATYILLITSSFIGLGYLIVACGKMSMEKAMRAMIIILTGPAGLLYFTGEFVLRNIFRKSHDVDFGDYALSRVGEEGVALPDTTREMQIIPLEEIFLTSPDAEKRKHLLFELKKDYLRNYRTIKKAFDDSDTETSHYAAAAVSSIKGEYEMNLRKLETRYLKATDAKKLRITRKYSDYLMDYIGTSIPDEYELEKYHNQYIKLMTDIPDDNFLTSDDYQRIVNSLIAAKKLPQAERMALKSLEISESEASYLNLLKVYYYARRTGLFQNTLDQLKQSDISLSKEGLNLVRFFLKNSG